MQTFHQCHRGVQVRLVLVVSWGRQQVHVQARPAAGIRAQTRQEEGDGAGGGTGSDFTGGVSRGRGM